MCKAISEGGQRCAAHTRGPAQAALAVMNEKGPSSLNDAELTALAEYASTPTGQEEFLTELRNLTDAVQAGYNTSEDVTPIVAREAVIASALARGQQMREANLETRDILAPETAPKKSPFPPVSEWTASTPIWPNRATTDAAVANTNCVTDEDKAEIKKTFRSQYAKHWRNMFNEHPDGPPSEEEGRAWRKACAEAAARDVAGATPIPLSDLKRGMIVRTGWGTKRINGWTTIDYEKVLFTERGTAETGPRANAHPDARPATSIKVQFTDGHNTGWTWTHETFIALPGMDEKPATA